MNIKTLLTCTMLTPIIAAAAVASDGTPPADPIFNLIDGEMRMKIPDATMKHMRNVAQKLKTRYLTLRKEDYEGHKTEIEQLEKHIKYIYKVEGVGYLENAPGSCESLEIERREAPQQPGLVSGDLVATAAKRMMEEARLAEEAREIQIATDAIMAQELAEEEDVEAIAQRYTQADVAAQITDDLRKEKIKALTDAIMAQELKEENDVEAIAPTATQDAIPAQTADELRNEKIKALTKAAKKLNKAKAAMDAAAGAAEVEVAAAGAAKAAGKRVAKAAGKKANGKK